MIIMMLEVNVVMIWRRLAYDIGNHIHHNRQQRRRQQDMMITTAVQHE